MSTITLQPDELNNKILGGIDAAEGTCTIYLPNSIGVDADAIEVAGTGTRFVRSPRLSRNERRSMVRHQQARWDVEDFDDYTAPFQAFGR